MWNDVLERYVQNGYLRKHETDDLIGYNYTDKTTYEKKWDEITLEHRGTIYEKSSGKIVARSFSKFFNYSEQPLTAARELEIAEGHCYLQTKMDGSLGIIYWYDDKWNVATRGSFTSDQAVKATEMLSKYNMGMAYKWLTYLVEVIYPENKIIVPYGGDEKLVLLAIRNTERGGYATPEFLEAHGTILNMPVTQVERSLTIKGALAQQDKLPWTKEGWVAVFRDGFRLKIKGTDYLRIAKFKANLSPLSVWEALSTGRYRDMAEGCPEEVRSELEDIQRRLLTDFDTLLCALPTMPTGDRKAVALAIKELPTWMHNPMFERLAGRDGSVSLWKLLRPAGNTFVDTRRYTE